MHVISCLNICAQVFVSFYFKRKEEIANMLTYLGVPTAFWKLKSAPFELNGGAIKTHAISQMIESQFQIQSKGTANHTHVKGIAQFSSRTRRA